MSAIKKYDTPHSHAVCVSVARRRTVLALPAANGVHKNSIKISGECNIARRAARICPCRPCTTPLHRGTRAHAVWGSVAPMNCVQSATLLVRRGTVTCHRRFVQSVIGHHIQALESTTSSGTQTIDTDISIGGGYRMVKS